MLGSGSFRWNKTIAGKRAEPTGRQKRASSALFGDGGSKFEEAGDSRVETKLECSDPKRMRKKEKEVASLFFNRRLRRESAFQSSDTGWETVLFDSCV